MEIKNELEIAVWASVFGMHLIEGGPVYAATQANYAVDDLRGLNTDGPKLTKVEGAPEVADYYQGSGASNP